MRLKIGVELAPRRCRIASIEGGGRSGEPTRVLRFESLPLEDPETSVRLRTLRGRRVNVVAWEIASDHRHVTVQADSYDRMRAAACRASGSAVCRASSSLADIAPASPPVQKGESRTVFVESAPRAAVDRTLRPLLEAGVIPRMLTTPAGALWSLARLRQPVVESDGAELYVVVDESSSWGVLMAGGFVKASGQITWGYRDGERTALDGNSLEAVVKGMSEQLDTFVREAGCSQPPRQVCVCSGFPQLRTLCARLTEVFDIEVEPMDSLFDVDADRLPEPADAFRDRISEARIAWAVAVDSRPQLNLLRQRERQVASMRFARAAVAAGVVAGLGVGFGVESLWPAALNAHAAPEPRHGTASIDDDIASNAPDVTALSGEARPASARSLPEHDEKVAPREGSTSLLTDPSLKREAAPPIQLATPPPVVDVPVAGAGRLPPDTEAFEAAVSTILVGADRALAIVDGRIVTPGDQIRGARILEIKENGIILKDKRDQVRWLPVGPSGP